MAALFELLLNSRNEIGEGELGRLLRELQHRHFTPPTDSEVGHVSMPRRVVRRWALRI